MHLLKSQHNDIFDLIIQAGLSPSQFTIGKVQDPVTILSGFEKTRISVAESEYFLEFAIEQGKHIVRLAPGSQKFTEAYQIKSEWSEKRKYVSLWLQNLKREIDQPDKWADFLKSAQGIEWDLTSSDNERFTYQEVEEIIASKERAKIRIAELHLPPEQLRLIEERLDYIAEKAKSLGKVDWKNIMLGTLVALIVQLALPPETTKALWLILKEAFQRIILIALR